MLKPCIRITLAVVLLNLAPAFASAPGNDACQALVAEGRALLAEGKAQQALDTFERARKADPQAATPLTSIGHLLLVASEQAPAEQSAKMRKQAESALRAALRIDGADPMAQESLRYLLDKAPPPLHVASAAASSAVDEGEALFQRKRYSEALAKYELAIERDHLYSGAWVLAGDCFYAQQSWAEAESRFRKATEIEPLNGQAWRFLSDALAAQGKRDASEAALFSGIAAHPSQLPTWDKLAARMARMNTPLKPLALAPKARADFDPKTGKHAITVTDTVLKETADFGVWFSLAASQVKMLDAPAPRASPFQADLEGWRTALAVAAEMQANKVDLKDPALVTMAMLGKAQQLEPAIFLLIYREAYRPDFEAWKRAHPDGIKAFVAAYGLRP